MKAFRQDWGDRAAAFRACEEALYRRPAIELLEVAAAELEARAPAKPALGITP